MLNSAHSLTHSDDVTKGLTIKDRITFILWRPYTTMTQTWLMSETKLLQSDLQCSTSRRIISWPDDDDCDTTFLLSAAKSFSFESPSSRIRSASYHQQFTIY